MVCDGSEDARSPAVLEGLNDVVITELVDEDCSSTDDSEALLLVLPMDHRLSYTSEVTWAPTYAVTLLDHQRSLVDCLVDIHHDPLE